MFNNETKSNIITPNIPIPDPNAFCNINTNLHVTGGLQTDCLDINSTTSLEGNTTMGSLDVKSSAVLRNSLSVSGLSKLGPSSISSGNINIQNTSVTGLSVPINNTDAVNYSYYLSSFQQVFQYVSSQYKKSILWPQFGYLSWEALKESTYETENASKMFSYQNSGEHLQIVLPGTYQINVSFNKGAGFGNTGGQINLALFIGAEAKDIAMGNNYTQYVLDWGNASISNCLGAMFTLSEQDIQEGSYLVLENVSQGSFHLTYFNYRLTRYACIQ